MQTAYGRVGERLYYVYRSVGAWGLLKRLAHIAISPLYSRDACHVGNKYLDHANRVRKEETGPGSIRGVVVDSAMELRTLKGPLDPHFSIEQLARFLETRPNRFLLMFEEELEDGSVRYIGQRECERGWFSLWSGARSGPIGDNIVMIYSNVVAPEHRGKRVTKRTRNALYNYLERIGADRTTSVIRTHNRSSLRSHLNPEPGVQTTVNGVISQVRLFGGLITWRTPWDRVKSCVEGPPGRAHLPGVTDNAPADGDSVIS